MTIDQTMIAVILLVTLGLFVSGRFRHDVVAALAALACVLTGLVPAERVFEGFSHPAVITVAAVLVVSDALRRSGLVDWIASHLTGLTHNSTLHVLVLTAAVTVASAFMNNVGALALFLPIALATAHHHQRSPGILLMPLAFGSILGGMTTAIGTPPNIIIATFRAEQQAESFAFFDFTAVGGVVALCGVLFIALIGWHLIPKARRSSNQPQGLFAIEEYLVELRLAEDNDLVGSELSELSGLNDGLEVVGVARFGRLRTVSPRWRLAVGDVLLLRGDIEQVPGFAEDNGLLLEGAPQHGAGDTDGNTPAERDLELVEGVVQQGSRLDGRRISELSSLTAGGLTPLALARQGRIMNRRLADQLFKPGDVLLVQGERSVVDQQFYRLGVLPLAERDLSLGQPRRLLLAGTVFALAITAGAAGWLPLPAAFCIAVLAYLLLDILPLRSLYEPIDWPILVLLALMLPVGGAIQSTGLAATIADVASGLVVELPAFMIVALVMLITMCLSDVINNAATAVVMAPIARDMALALNFNPDPLLMAVAVGASCAFLTPIGHQSNTLVMGPGGYTFGDYWRMGLPLELLILLVGTPMLLWVWPI
ncbi:SLC13 family permease [Motiliproteus sediminis]|uniref:SLC13 family permease n=1 Tax=Motiliproteus sediminis TaxID=1468178 RepID=UPI001AEF7E0B|nr:SLC13 family permease [Motiliproteus sediminis]